MCPRNKKDKTSLRSRIKSWLLKAALLPLTVALGTIVSMYLPISVPVEIKAEVNRVSLTAAGGENNPLLPHTAICSLDLGGFKEIRLPSASIWVGDPKRADRRTGAIPETGWRMWIAGRSLVLQPSQPRFPAKITLKTITNCGAGLSVDGFHTGTDEVVIASPERDYLSIDLHGEQQGSVALPDEFEMNAEYCGDPNLPFPLSAPEMRLRIRLSEGASSFLRFASPGSGMFAQLEFAPGQMQASVISNFRVQRVDFTNQGPLERPESTLIGPGRISYYGKSIDLAAGDALTADKLNQFSVLELEEGSGNKSLSILMKGRAGILKTGRAVDIKDRRPTLFDALSGDQRLRAVGKAIKAVRDIFK